MTYVSLSALDLVKRSVGVRLCLRSIGEGVGGVRVKELAKRIFFWGPVGGAIVAIVRAKGTSSSASYGENRAQESWQWCDPGDE